jgi:hypothetical protein
LIGMLVATAKDRHIGLGRVEEAGVRPGRRDTLAGVGGSDPGPPHNLTRATEPARARAVPLGNPQPAVAEERRACPDHTR